MSPEQPFSDSDINFPFNTNNVAAPNAQLVDLGRAYRNDEIKDPPYFLSQTLWHLLETNKYDCSRSDSASAIYFLAMLDFHIWSLFKWFYRTSHDQQTRSNLPCPVPKSLSEMRDECDKVFASGSPTSIDHDRHLRITIMNLLKMLIPSWPTKPPPKNHGRLFRYSDLRGVLNKAFERAVLGSCDKEKSVARLNALEQEVKCLLEQWHKEVESATAAAGVEDGDDRARSRSAVPDGMKRERSRSKSSSSRMIQVHGDESCSETHRGRRSSNATARSRSRSRRSGGGGEEEEAGEKTTLCTSTKIHWTDPIATKKLKYASLTSAASASTTAAITWSQIGTSLLLIIAVLAGFPQRPVEDDNDEEGEEEEQA